MHSCQLGVDQKVYPKNLYSLAGISLVERSVRLARQCSYIDDVFVSTEDPEIRELSVCLQAATPNPRPTHLATDSARTIDVLVDLVDTTYYL